MKLLGVFFTVLSSLAYAFELPHSEYQILIENMRNDEAPVSIFVTGFGPFSYIKDNPSARIAPLLAEQIKNSCAKPEWAVLFKKMQVEPGIILHEPLQNYRTVISLGVADGSRSIRLEQYARNWYEDGHISKKIEPTLESNFVCKGKKYPMPIPNTLKGFSVEMGDEHSAGSFVCNETYFQLCMKHSNGYFIHIPNIPQQDDEAMSRALSRIICDVI